MKRIPEGLMAALLLAIAPWLRPDVNIPRPADEIEQELATAPFVITAAEISRPKAKGDITLKAEVSFAGAPPYRVKLRRAEPGAEDFNNRPRYDLAAYELQKLFLDPAEYVVPPTALRMMPLAELRPHSPEAKPTFKGSDDVLVVLQYWLNEVKVIADVYNPERFAADPKYARHIGQLNVLTFLIEHGDSNVGNFLISRAETGPRVFSIDNGVAFEFNESDRGQLWMKMRVDRLPADTVQRLRRITLEEMHRSPGRAGAVAVEGWPVGRDGAGREPGAGARRPQGGRRRAARTAQGRHRPGRTTARAPAQASRRRPDRHVLRRGDASCARADRPGIPPGARSVQQSGPPCWPFCWPAAFAPTNRSQSRGRGSSASWPSRTCMARTRSSRPCCVPSASWTKTYGGPVAARTWSASATCSTVAPTRARSWTC